VDGREETLLLREETIVIGRKSDTDLVVESPYVSRHHAKLVKGPQGYTLLDLDSSHGTFVNGDRIAEHELQSGDRIALGKERVELVYYTDEGETAGKEANRQERQES
jgi:pSer/pThr/pTyr-binding forkhead associated (FHA) protein